MFWDAKKTDRLNEEFKDRLLFLQNNFFVYQDHALVGTKGYTFEGPFYLDFRGRIVGWDEEKEARARKLVKRETARLRESFRQAKEAGYEIYHVSSLSADQYPGGNIAVYRDRGRIRGHRSCIFPLPWRKPVRGQLEGRISRCQIYAGLRRLPELSSGAGDEIRGRIKIKRCIQKVSCMC